MKQEQEKAVVRFMGQKACYTENSKRNCFLQKKEGFLNGIYHEYKNGHIEVYDFSGRFLFSADNMEEARWDLREMGVAC